MAWYDDPVIVTAVAVVIIFACGVVIFAMRRLGKKSPQPKNPRKRAITVIDPSFEYLRFTVQNFKKCSSNHRF